MSEAKNERPIALLGSSRRQGNTGELLDIVADKLEIEVIDIAAADISPFDYEHKNLHDDFVPMLNRLLQHDDIIFASPVYWYSMSAQMKVFFDRLSDLLDLHELKDHGRALRGKRAHVISTSISSVSGAGFDESFEKTFSYLGMELGSRLHIDCSNGLDRAGSDQLLQGFISSLGLAHRE